MKRIRVVGLCLMATFAVSAVIVASAQAGPITYESTNPPTPTLETPHAGQVKCKEGAKGKGEVNSAQGGKSTVTFFGCETLGFTCNSKGAKAGEITTLPLVTVVGYVNKPKDEVGTDFLGEKEIEFEAEEPRSKKIEKFKGPGSSEFECVGGALQVATIGSVIGASSGNLNSMSETSTTKFEGEPFSYCEGVGTEFEYVSETKCENVGVGKGKYKESVAADNQKITKFEGGPSDTLFTHVDSHIPGKEANVILPSAELTEGTAKDTATRAAKKAKKVLSEVRTKTGPKGEEQLAQPEQGQCVKKKNGKYADKNCTEFPKPKGKPPHEKPGKGKYEWEVA